MSTRQKQSTTKIAAPVARRQRQPSQAVAATNVKTTRSAAPRAVRAAPAALQPAKSPTARTSASAPQQRAPSARTSAAPVKAWKTLDHGLLRTDHLAEHPQAGPIRDGLIQTREHAVTELDGTLTSVKLFRGTERLTTVALTASTPIGSNSLTAYPNGFQVNPLFLGSRLPLEAVAYSKYQFTKIKFHYIPGVNGVTPGADGSFIMGFNGDPAQGLPEVNEDGINAVATWGKNQKASRWIDYCSLDADLVLDAQAELFVDSNDQNRFSVQGTFGVFTERNSGANLTYGTVYVDYEIQLSEPNLPSSTIPVMYAAFTGVVNGTSGNAALGASQRYWGNTDIVTKLATPVSGAQFVLNTPNPGNQRNNWLISVSGYNTIGGQANTPAAAINVTGGSYANGWGADYTYFGISSGSPNVQSSNANLTAGAFSGRSTGSNATAQWNLCFSTRGPAFLTFIPPASATNSDFTIVIARVDNDVIARASPNAPFVSANAFRNIEMIIGESIRELPQLIALINGYADDVNSGRAAANSIDIAMLTACHGAMGTTAPVLHKPAAVPDFLPLLASAASWLLAKFGPTIAAGVLHLGVSKLEKYANGGEETEDRRIRPERRRKRVVYEDEDDDADDRRPRSSEI
eukprot:TRINITY_DN826_c0_g1_i1.p1 TRINITY_DN826_c0_g1~~TRINITY_DN826_c0_g1_i1.p1  ORF type:complete len:645 (+),score=-90.66 TRINITY_DN826_c0_g1_i1:40-1935(+)